MPLFHHLQSNANQSPISSARKEHHEHHLPTNPQSPTAAKTHYQHYVSSSSSRAGGGGGGGLCAFGANIHTRSAHKKKQDLEGTAADDNHERYDTESIMMAKLTSKAGVPVCVVGLSRSCHGTLFWMLTFILVVVWVLESQTRSPCAAFLPTTTTTTTTVPLPSELKAPVDDDDLAATPAKHEKEEKPYIRKFHTPKEVIVYDKRPQKCSWTSTETVSETIDCLQHSLPYFGAINATNPNTIFLGDSTMARLWYFFFHRAMDYSLPLGSGGSCTCHMKIMDQCYGTTKEDVVFPDQLRGKWTGKRRPTDTEKEGPTGYGVSHPGCMDCTSCHSRVFFCSRQCEYRPPSFFGVEFARDSSLQTKSFTTTQENVAHLLVRRFTNLTLPSWQPKREQLCVVNAGMHDMAIPNITDHTYIDNVRWYLRTLSPACDHLLWVSLSSVIEKIKYKQRNTRIKKWNQMVEKLLRKDEFRSWTSLLNVYDVTVDWKHENPVHLERTYYFELAHILNNAVFVTPASIDR